MNDGGPSAFSRVTGVDGGARKSSRDEGCVLEVVGFDEVVLEDDDGVEVREEVLERDEIESTMVRAAYGARSKNDHSADPCARCPKPLRIWRF